MSRAKKRPRPRAADPARRYEWRPIAIAAAALLAYATSFGGPFIFDDFGSIARNTSIRDLSNLGAVFSPPDATPVAGRLLVNLSFAVNYAIGGLNVTGYHVAGLTFHIAVGILLFTVIRRTLEICAWSEQPARSEQARAVPAPDLAFVIALLWTVHPLTSEVVLYLTERTESMMAIFYLLTLYASIRARRSPRSAPWLWFAVLSCAAGMLCKESMVTAPFMVAVYDRVFLFDTITAAWRARWRFYAGLAACWPVLAASLLSHGSISSGGFASARTTTWMYLLNQALIITRYLRLVVWPEPLVLYYGWTRALTLADVWPYAVGMVALGIAAVVLFVRWPRFGFPAIWTIVTLSPASSIAAVAAEVGAERRMYLPLTGLITLAAVSVALAADARLVKARGWRPRLARSFLPASLVLAILLGATTLARAKDYSSALRMARTVVTGWESPSAHQLLGQELSAAGDRDEAIRQLRLALPEATPAYYFLGSELVSAGQYDEGITNLQQFVRLEPSLAPAKTARILMARAFAAKQQWPQAIEQLNAVLEATPSDAAVHGLLANMLASQQTLAEAIPHYRAYLVANPHDANAWTGLGIALISTDKKVEATNAFREAVNAEPTNPHFHQNLARVLLDTGDIAGAAIEAQQSLTLSPGDAAAHDLLARVLIAQGRQDDARREFERALQIDPKYAPAREALNALGR